jgi:hypothetical protein
VTCDRLPKRGRIALALAGGSTAVAVLGAARLGGRQGQPPG